MFSSSLSLFICDCDIDISSGQLVLANRLIISRRRQQLVIVEAASAERRKPANRPVFTQRRHRPEFYATRICRDPMHAGTCRGL